MILLNILAHDTLNEQADAPGWILPVVLAVVVIAFVAIGAVILKGIMRDSGDTSQRAPIRRNAKSPQKPVRNLVAQHTISTGDTAKNSWPLRRDQGGKLAGEPVFGERVRIENLPQKWGYRGNSAFTHQRHGTPHRLVPRVKCQRIGPRERKNRVN